MGIAIGGQGAKVQPKKLDAEQRTDMEEKGPKKPGEMNPNDPKTPPKGSVFTES